MWTPWSPSAGSSWGESRKESSRGLRRSLSPSRTSSRSGSASPGGEKRYTRSRSPSPSRRADEDRQEEQSSLDFVSVVTTLRFLNELPEAPSESCKICGFWAAVKDDDQPASSFKMPVGGAAVDIDDRVSSPSSRLCSKEGLEVAAVSRYQQQEVIQVQGGGRDES